MVESTTSTSGRPTVSGLASGINSSSIIDAFIAAERGATRILEKNKTLVEGRQTAVRTFNTRMLSAQLDLGELKRASTFQSRAATSSKEEALAVTGTSTTAVPGSYVLDVLQVGLAHQIATPGQLSAETAFSSGSLSVQLGSDQATQITFSAGGSLNDIAAAINDAQTGITASVINDGSATPYRLVLKGDKTGAANTILANGTGGLTALFSGMSTLVAADDAKVRVGAAPGGITITQASNSFADVVPGVNLDVRGLANGITINVTADTKSAKDSIGKFVESFNSALTYLKQNTGFDATTKSGGALIGQAGLVNDMGRLVRALSGSVQGLPAPFNNLASIGITLSRTDNTLVIDQTKLNKALTDNPDSVRRLFTNTGTSSNPAVQFSNLSEKTRTGTPFTVNITQPALQASLTTTGLAASTEITNLNNTLSLTVNGRAVNLTLTNGTYTRAQLAEHLQASLDGALPSASEKIDVSLAGTSLGMHSERYGRTQTIRIEPVSTALAALGLTVQSVSGTDVAGTINGVAGTANGRLLNGATGSDAQGLSLNITSTTAVSGVTVNATKGLGQLIGERFSAMTDNSLGSISSLDKTMNKNIADATKQIARADALLAKRRERYERQFQTMERMIASFNAQGTAMTNFVNSLTPKQS